jgi:hypothetical protein
VETAGITPLEAALVVAALALPFYFFTSWQLARLVDPDYVRRQGVVILREEILQQKSAVIGYYAGREIHATVTFMGMVYRFDRVVLSSYSRSVRERELFLEPGLLYVTD